MIRGKPRDAFGEPVQAEQRYVAWQGFASEATGFGAVATGAELSGDDAVVRAHAANFVPAGTPRERWPNPRLARSAGRMT